MITLVIEGATLPMTPVYFMIPDPIDDRTTTELSSKANIPTLHVRDGRQVSWLWDSFYSFGDSNAHGSPLPVSPPVMMMMMMMMMMLLPVSRPVMMMMMMMTMMPLPVSPPLMMMMMMMMPLPVSPLVMMMMMMMMMLCTLTFCTTIAMMFLLASSSHQFIVSRWNIKLYRLMVCRTVCLYWPRSRRAIVQVSGRQ